jgi:sporulation protein YlmC with PRC-barrel domain
MQNVKEASNLISSTKVAGSSVYDPNGENIGAIEDVVLDQDSGKVAYAVMSHGGFLGFGKTCQSLPWSILSYDRRRRAYVADFSKANLSDVPGYPVVNEFECDDQDFESRLHSYYDHGPLGMP